MHVQPMRVTSALLLAAVTPMLVVGCGGHKGGADASGGSGGMGAAGSGGTTGSGGADGGAMCGDARCGSNQVCVNPSCGGVLIQICFPLGDAAACPDGYMMRDCANEDGGLGCVPPPCTPPPPSCADIPAACAGTPSCSCFPENICRQPNGIGGRCAAVNAGNVLCLSS